MIRRFWKSIVKLMIVGGALGAVACLGINNVRAEEDSLRIQLSPSHINFGELSPGEVYEGKFQVNNNGTMPYDYELDVLPYAISADNGQLEVGTVNEYTAVVNWITLEKKTARLQAGEQSEVNFRITVPTDSPGGAQGALITARAIREKDKADETGVMMEQQLGMRVYGNIKGGNTRYTAELLEMKSPMFSFTPSITMGVLVKNTGNVFVDATHIVEVRSAFDDNILYTNERDVADNRFSVYPGAQVGHSVAWNDGPQLGLFKIKQIVIMAGETKEEEKILLVCPIWFLVFCLAFVAVLTYCIVDKVRQNKKLKSLEEATRGDKVVMDVDDTGDEQAVENSEKM